MLPQLINPWDNTTANQRRVAIPVSSILLLAFLLIANLAVDEQDAEVKHEEICENGSPTLSLRCLHCLLLDRPSSRVHGFNHDITRNTGGEAVGPGHDPVTQVVDVTGETPPAGGHQFGTTGGLDELEVLDAGVIVVRAEAVLLVVGTAEDRVT